MMWYFRETFHELLVRQSGQIHFLIIAPILTLFFLSLIVRSADSAIGSAAEKEKVAAQLRKRLEEVREGETLLAKESLPPASPSLAKEKGIAQPEEQLQEGAESKTLAAKEPSGSSSPQPAEEKHKIRKRETFATILRSKDLDAKEVKRWIQAAKGVRELKKLRPGHPLIFRFDRKRSRLQEIAYEINSRTALVIRDQGEGIEVSKEALPVTLEWKGATGRIKSNLYTAAVRAGVPDKTISEVVDIFSWEIDFFSDLQPGDTFKVIYEEFMRDGRMVQVGRILAAEIFNKGKSLTAFYVDDQDGHQGYYNSQGHSIGSHFLKYPLEFTRISSVFKYSRFHPILKVKRPHLGVDFAAPTGTPVRAVASGKVVRAGYRRDFGNHVKIAHNGLYASSYSHLKRITKGIKVGTQVKVGQVIGQVGSTGLATGPHLHYALYKGKRYINPLSFDNKLLARKTEAPKRVNGSFAKIKKQLVDYLAALQADSSPLTVSLAVPKGFVTLPN
jgi:murein DD-endopeptidase MepM/ murein hydrolase activator NlpD